MLLEATTKISSAAYGKYFIFNFMQGKKSPWQARLLIILPPLMVAAFLVLYYLDPTDIVNLIGLFLAAIFGLILYLIIMVVPQRYYKSVQKLMMIPMHYKFTEDFFWVTPEGTRQVSQSGLSYAQLTKVFETPEYFYLYLQSNQSHILSKSDFTRGTPTDLRQFLTAKLGGRFQITKAAKKTAITPG